MPEIKLSAPTLLSTEQQKITWNELPIEHVFVNRDNGQWTIVTTEAQKVTTYQSEVLPLMIGTQFEESEDGIYALSLKTGERKQRVTNARVRIVGKREHWLSDSQCEIFLKCSIRCDEAWGTKERLFEVKKTQIKSLFKLLHNEYGELQLTSQSIDVLEEYLTAVFQRDFKNDGKSLPCEISSAQIGWLGINGLLEYYKGDAPFYTNFEIADVNGLKRSDLFQNGFGVREIGHFNNEIEFLWLFAHAPYCLYLLRKGEADVRTIVFLTGETNNFKTSLIKLISNVFCDDSRYKAVPLSSTEAFLQDYISSFKDNLLFIDDLSNTAFAKNAKMRQNVETLIRAVGDGVFSGKMSVTNNGKMKSDVVRSLLIICGEENIDLDKSSLYRTLMINVDGAFDKNILSRYQRDSDIIRNYFSLFIQFRSSKKKIVVVR